MFPDFRIECIFDSPLKKEFNVIVCLIKFIICLRIILQGNSGKWTVSSSDQIGIDISFFDVSVTSSM